MPGTLVLHHVGGTACRRLLLGAVCFMAAVHLAAGCAGPIRFPASPLAAAPLQAGAMQSYDTDGNGQPDYFTMQDATGRTVRIAYDTLADGRPDAFVNLDDIPVTDCRHVVFMLDGIGYETVEAYRREGGLRLFHPPAPVVSTFPAMTDLVFTDMFQSARCRSYEAVYFDHATNRRTGGDADYLSMLNEDWARCTDYRASTIVDPLAYLFPGFYFEQEVAEVGKLFDRRDRPRLVAYLVSSAGLGTKELLEGQQKVLRRIDRMAEELVWKTRGLVKMTILTDHGHALVRCKWIDFSRFLKAKGWNVRDRLEGPRDVVPIEYGLVTYGSFATRDRPGLAATLLENEGVDVVTYAADASVVVESAAGKAFIDRRGSRYRYRPATGDPLGLVPIIQKAREEAKAGDPPLFDGEDFAEDREWLRLTFNHEYPDALDRLWRAFHGLTEEVPDVIASLRLGYSAGLPSRAGRFADGASTHGDLARRNSIAFVMTTTEPIAPRWPYLRARDLPEALSEVTGRPWPPPRKGNGK